MRKLTFIVAASAIAGCASQSATLVNDKGEHRYCYKSATGTVSNIGATREYNKCLNEAGAAGFRMVEDR